jgi:hypothetical protein
MAVHYDFTWTDIIMTIGGHLCILLLIGFILLSDVGATIRSFPSKNVAEMIKEAIPSTQTLTKP